MDVYVRRRMKAALRAMRNKTDRNDARGIAQVMRTGWFRFVHVKSSESQELRLVLTHREKLQQPFNVWQGLKIKRGF